MMIPFSRLVVSSVGKKIITGVTGLGLCLFVIAHLIGNLTLLIGKDIFNEYTYKLESLGPVLYLLEGGLVLCFALHAMVGISIAVKSRSARPIAYKAVGYAGEPSHKSYASRSMIVTGIIMLGFLVIHLWSFKFGAPLQIEHNGVVMRDLYTLVITKFQTPLYAIGYTAVMLLLGMHLRHGFWSAFQSLGLTNPRLKPVIFGFGIFFATAIAVGFLMVPMWVYFS